MKEKILVINPGSGSTKIAIYEGETLKSSQNIKHSDSELAAFKSVFEQTGFRTEAITHFLEKNGERIEGFSAIAGRGGPIAPLPGGTYIVDERLEYALKHEYTAEHVSLLGGLIAKELASPYGIPAFIVDPVSVDEMCELARFSGLPEIPRVSLSHALNIKSVARKAARELGRSYSELRLVIAHLGSGISVTSHENGRMIDVNNANEEGPFSPERAGTLPACGLVKYALSSGKTEKELIARITKKGGLLAYLGTSDAFEIERRIQEGDGKARIVYEAMIYQIAKEIGAYATTLMGRLDAVIITGGLAKSNYLVEKLRERIGYLGKILVYPGEDELEALALGALRVLRGEEQASRYSPDLLMSSKSIQEKLISGTN